MKQLVILLMLISTHGYSQHQAVDKFLGVWKGTSICQIKNSPCKDEHVVYYISAGTSKNSYIMKANKVVNNQEEEMGTLDFNYDETTQSIINKRTDKMNRVDVWKFKVDGPNLNGTLTVDGVLYRIIQVKKDG